MFEFSADGIIGANLLFADNSVYPFNIYCMTDCSLLHMTKEAVTELLCNFGFVICYIKSLSQNSQGMNRKIAMFTQKSLRENIIDYLTAQTALQRSSTIILPVTKKQLADYFGVQRPSLFRELKKLSDERIITIDNRRITMNKHINH
jgi:CRP-like cAMP-binding protein